jgi:hypothetical protein
LVHFLLTEENLLKNEKFPFLPPPMKDNVFFLCFYIHLLSQSFLPNNIS